MCAHVCACVRGLLCAHFFCAEVCACVRMCAHPPVRAPMCAEVCGSVRVCAGVGGARVCHGAFRPAEVCKSAHVMFPKVVPCIFLSSPALLCPFACFFFFFWIFWRIQGNSDPDCFFLQFPFPFGRIFKPQNSLSTFRPFLNPRAQEPVGPLADLPLPTPLPSPGQPASAPLSKS